MLTLRQRADLCRLSGGSVPAAVPEAGPADPSPGPGESELTDGMLESCTRSRARAARSLPFPSWHQLVGFITSASVLMYAGGPLAFGALRKQQPRAARPYRMPAGGFWSPVAFIIANLIIYWSGWNVIWRLGAAIVLGYVLIGLSIAVKVNPNTPSLDWKSAQWLPAYLIGLGIISWQGTFGTGAAGHLGLWWDILVIAVFSLVIYYWAIAVRLPDAKAEEYISHHHLRSQPGE